MGTTGGDKDSLSRLLVDSPALDTELIKQPLPQLPIKIEGLRVYRIVLEGALEVLSQELTNLPRVLRTKDVPDGAARRPIWRR